MNKTLLIDHKTKQKKPIGGQIGYFALKSFRNDIDTFIGEIKFLLRQYTNCNRTINSQSRSQSKLLLSSSQEPIGGKNQK